MSEAKAFTLTENHVALLSECRVGWQDVEFGAPAIDPKRPYGNSNVFYDMHEILTGQHPEEHWDHLPRELEERYEKLHKETATALQVVLATGSFEPGEYSAPAYSNAWSRSDSSTTDDRA